MQSAPGGTVTDTPDITGIPYRTRTSEAKRHFGFIPFFAKKPWNVVQEYIKHYRVYGETICDPFCGSGVTAVESLVLGRRAIATDINRLARFITRMTAVSPVHIRNFAKPTTPFPRRYKATFNR